MSKTRSFRELILYSVLLIFLIQGTLPVAMLFSSGVKETLQQHVADELTYAVEGQKVILESFLHKQIDLMEQEQKPIVESLTQTLEAGNADMASFVASEQLKEDFLYRVFPSMVDLVQSNQSSGAFLILASDKDVKEAATFQGFFLRDSDAVSSTKTNSDLLMERGPKELARSETIPLDNPWSTTFKLQGQNARAADRFYYEPYCAALENPTAQMKDLGYWAEPFILEDHPLDNHKMITYSQPLCQDGVIYGVVGLEFSLNELERYMPVQELSRDTYAGYGLLLDLGGGRFHRMHGKGSLDRLIFKEGEDIQASNGLAGLYSVQAGDKLAYAACIPLRLYQNNVPYSNTDWVLGGCISEDAVVSQGRVLYARVLFAVVFAAVLGFVCVVLVVGYMGEKMSRLLESVRGGAISLREYNRSGVREIDELHDVVENLTETQHQVENRLREESERYRMAVESARDVFFTWRRREKTLEIVNSRSHNGKWDLDKVPEFVDGSMVHPDDRRKFRSILFQEPEEQNVEVRFLLDPQQGYQWVQISLHILSDKYGDRDTVVGYIRNIQAQKDQQEALQKQRQMDPVSGCYRLNPGLALLRERVTQKESGSLALIDISRFAAINDQFGMVFGDILLERLAGILQDVGENYSGSFTVRAGADEFLMWLPETEREEAENILRQASVNFSALVRSEALDLGFRAGICYTDGDLTADLLLCRAQAALRRTDRIASFRDLYQNPNIPLPKPKFSEVASMGYVSQMTPVSLALNLFDKHGSNPAVLDILCGKLRTVYGLQSLLITKVNPEYAVNMLEYCWPPRETMNAAQYTEEDLQRCATMGIQEEYIPINAIVQNCSLFAPFLHGEEGLIIHMADDGQYFGSLLMLGLSEETLKSKDTCKELREVATLIQSWMIQDRHDAAAQAKADFLSRMSHEIRTPMNGIIGMTEIALRGGQTEDRRVDCLNKIRDSSNYLLNLLNDILDMSKIESGKMQLREAPFNLKELAKSLENLLASKMAEKELHYTADIQLEHSSFVGDDLRMEQVLVNLLGNAIKFTDRGGHIRLIIREQNVEGQMQLYFAVEDDGIGISPENQRRVFRSFEQANTGVSRQGTGLGLAISSKIVQMMGGFIELESELGKGSVFSFKLQMPFCREDIQESSGRRMGMTFPGKQVLVAEDNALNMEIITSILTEEFRMEVTGVENGQLAVDAIRENKQSFDLVFMDIMMPVMNGLDAAHAIRQLPGGRTIPIVAMSANAFDEDVKKSLAAGMNDHLAKPVDMQELEFALSKYLN